MKYFAVFLPMKDEEKSTEHRQAHLDYLSNLGKEGKIHSLGRFVDGAGGLVIYQGESFEEVEALVLQDPYVVHGARSYKIHEWEMRSGT